ncbi:putative ferric-chelate reductase 1 isoform X2 [Labrus bergylta]|uniref:putative ferric-chelate reductase 1 isoform X2 n=1 Tax=Labrus bergylta TaxID=56723 RepID=UPI0009B3A412|nr:putative ferric-chelate reductase 1 isoform X2 [Labrus bergylta]
MERGLILLVAAALMAYVAPGVQGTSHLSFSNNTEVNITRDGCGVTKLCVETPNDCDPSATNGTCLFGSATASTPMPPAGTNLIMELRGFSEGYVALGLTTDQSQGSTMLFVCAQNSSNNGSFFFRTMQRNNTNGALTPLERTVREIRGMVNVMVNGSVIKCEFEIPNANASRAVKDASTNFQVLLGTGPVVGGMIGDFRIALNTTLLTLTNPASTNVATTATPVAMTTNSASNGAHPHVLFLLSVLSLAVMLRT